jgi:ATP-dependent Lon protease
MKTIQEELGGNTQEEEIDEMLTKRKIKNGMKNQKHFEKNCLRCGRMNPQAPDFGIQRNYLDLFLELPWNLFKDNFDKALKNS